MKNKLQLFLVAVSVMTAAYFFMYNSENSELTSKEISKIREQHAKYLANSPFRESLKLSKKERKANGLPPNKYFERQWELSMDPLTGKTYPEKLLALQESLRSKNVASKVPGAAVWNNWEERGPNNVGGRTRAIMYDPNDATNKRVFAGGVSGGLWANNDITDENSEWSEVNTPKNLAVSSITYDPNNKNIFYLGTGESYVGGDVNGNGLWKSTDRGNNWDRIFGGISGETTFRTNVKMTVNSPESIVGEYQVTSASFGPEITTSISGNLVLASDGTEKPTEGCNALTNGEAINGKIAIVERGSCTFVSKVKNAQDVGAIAVLVVNNKIGPPITLGGDSSEITIPSFMVSEAEGLQIIEQLENGVNITFEGLDSPFTGSFVTPGIKHINDVKVRDIGDGNSEIFVAVGSSYYSNSSPSTLLGTEQYGLYKSVDKGTSWEEVILPLTENGNKYSPNDIEIGVDNTIWVSTIKSILYGDGGGTILSSIDGINFEVKHTITDGDRTQIAVSKLNAGLVYVLAELRNDNKLFLGKTIDGFVEITELNKPDDEDIDIPAKDFTRGQAYYDLLLEVDPNNDDIVYTGGIDLFRTEDGGVNWSQISKWSNNNNLVALSVSLVHADHHILVFNPSDSNQGVFGTDGGVFYGSSLTNSPSSPNVILARNKNYNTVQFYKGSIGQDKSAEKLAAGAQDNGTHLMNFASSGINASIEVSGGDGAYTFIDKDNEYMISSYVYNNYYYHNYSNGSYKYEITEFSSGDGYDNKDGDFINPAALDSDNNILYAAGQNSSAYKIYKYTLGLSSATKATLTNELLSSSPTAFKPSAYTTSTLFVGTETGKLLKILNANTNNPTWSDITGDRFYGSISSVEQGKTEDEIIVTFHNYGVKNIYFTEDGGETWKNKEGDFKDIPVKAVMMNPINPNEVIIGTDLGVWGTTNFRDENPTWFQSQNGMKDVQVTSFDLRTSDNTVLASTYGRGMFTAKFTVDNYEGDDDNDNVINGLDLCPDTPEGEEVNSDGCSQGQLDDDEDGVKNSNDLCLNTPAGARVNTFGCLVLTSDNFDIEVISETCPDEDNGQIKIETKESYDYITTINGTEYSFTSNLIVNDLAPGVYDFCINVTAENYEQCYTVEVSEGSEVSGKFSITNNKAAVEIEQGTAPFKVFVNGKEAFTTSTPEFSVDVKHGDVLEVKTAVSCEGVYAKTINLLDGIVVYPNPTKGNLEISLPISQKEVMIALYSSTGQLISNKAYSVTYGKVQLDLTSSPSGLYIAKVQLDKPVSLKIIKQ